MPHLLRPPARPLLLCALLLTGCATSPPAVVVPASMLRCSPAPPVPAAGDGDGALARFILDLAEAGEDCRTRLRLVGEIVTP